MGSYLYTMRLIALIALLILTKLTIGQHDPVVVDLGGEIGQHYSGLQWTTENGLPQNGAIHLAQTPDGYIWVGTFDGLSRFDGYEFTHIWRIKEEIDINTHIKHLIVDDHGFLWVLTELKVFRIKGNQIDSYPVPGGSPLKEFHLHLGELYIVGGDHLLVWKDGRFEPPDLAWSSPEPMSFKDVVTDRNGRLLLISHSNGLCEVRKHEIVPLFPEITDLGNFVSGPNQGVLIKASGGFYEVLGDSLIPRGKELTTSFDRFLQFYFSGGTRYLSMHKDSIEIFDFGKKLGSVRKRWFGPATEFATCLVDVEGNIWIGSTSGGLIMLSPKLFNPVTFPSDVPWGGNYVYEDKEGRMYAGKGCNGIWEVDGDTALSEPLFTDLRSCTWTLLRDSKDRYWFGALYQDLKRSRPDGGYDVLRPPGFSSMLTTCLFEDSQQRVWVGTGSGLHRWDEADSTFFTPVGQPDTLPVFQILEGPDGTIWVATPRGVGKVVKDEMLFITKADGLPTSDVRSLHLESDGVLWIGTAGQGLCRYRDGHIFHFPFGDGKINRNVWSILEDSYGYLWMSSNQGIYRTSKTQLNLFASGTSEVLTTIHLSTRDGMINAEYNSRTQNKAFESKDGTFWFSSIAGPVKVDPQSIAHSVWRHNILFEHIIVDGEERLDSNSLVLSPDFNHITFEFTLPSFYLNRNLTFEYRLLGLSNVWKSAPKSRSITFNHLEAGNYTFEVRLAGGEKLIRKSFTVQQAFWNKPLVIAALALAAGLVFFLVFLWIYSTRRRRLRRQRRMERQLADLELQAFEAQLSPHFVFNCLNSIQFLFLEGRTLDANEYMSQFSQLLRSLLEHVRQPVVSLQEEIGFLKNYVSLESLQFERPIKFEADISELGTEYYVPSMILQSIVENAIKHGFKRSDSETHILRIKAHIADGLLQVEIEDNGRGLDAEGSIFSEKRNRNSKGIVIIKERLASLNALTRSEMSFKIESLEAPNTGTRAVFKFATNLKAYARVVD